MNNKLFIYLLLLLILVTTSFSAYWVIRHYDLYANDPLVYGAKSYNLESCTCITSDGGTLNFDQEEVTTIIRYKAKGERETFELNNLTNLK